MAGYPHVEGLRLHGTIIEGRFVGGDHYDFIKLSPPSVLLLVGDVSGKGVPAALIIPASERSNPAGEFYGLNSLRSFIELNRHLDCPDFIGLLLKEVRQFGANTPLEDDLTLVMALKG